MSFWATSLYLRSNAVDESCDVTKGQQHVVPFLFLRRDSERRSRWRAVSERDE